MTSFALFDTAIGCCGILWSETGIARVSFPGPSRQATLAALVRRRPGALEVTPGPEIGAVIDQVVRLLAGEPVDLGGVAVDFGDAPEFNRRVYAVARSIPVGETLTYGQVAERVGDKNAAQAVGKALGANPVPIIVPCHRVLAKDGRTGGFSAPGGVDTKMRILSIERARTGPPSLFGDLPLAAKPRRFSGVSGRG
jgi:methylated-DNA-[protein]-cysteine S-methyltransferase